MYENGHPVQQDYGKAYTWYYIAAGRLVTNRPCLLKLGLTVYPMEDH